MRAIQMAVALAVLVAGAQMYADTAADATGHMAWWKEARFGMFIHWGPVSIKGTEIGWSRGGERRGTGGGKGQIPVDVYDNLYKEFNPTKFDAKQWVAIAKQAGMKYLVFTSKHHDGFCEFDSALTDYKITNTPFKRDVVAELVQASHEAGLKIGFYYSPVDWHHPDYRTENHVRYVEYLHGQLRELCTKYGKIDIIWFDGLGGTAKDWDAERLEAMIRELQPGVIINDRAGLPADHSTPEQTIGRFDRNRAWETCMTIGDQWAWKPKDNIKSVDKCLEVLVRCAGGDGNLLFNVGPMPTGEIEPRQVEKLVAMGKWLEQYGESIYGTRGGPYKPGKWGASTCKDNKVYIHVLEWPESGPLELAPIDATINEVKIWAGGAVQVTQTDTGIAFDVPEDQRVKPDTIIVLTLDRPAVDVSPVSTASPSAATGRKASASQVYLNMSEFGADKAFDDDPGTRWATNGGTSEAWLAVELGKPMKIGQALISEACAPRVQDFEIQYKDAGEWIRCFKGSTIGEHFDEKFLPVTSAEFRLKINKAADGPTIWEFVLIPAK